MTSAPGEPLALRPDGWLHRQPPSTSARLWPMLASARPRRPIAKGFDVLGEAVTGWAARMRARRLDRARAQRVIDEAAKLSKFSDAALDVEIAQARERVVVHRDDPASIDAAFAVAYEAVRRETGLSLHIEQVLGAFALAQGCCAELATGEGKTVTAILPAALDGWMGRGVHVVTVNDYLARRDAEITGGAYRRLGLTVGVIQDNTPPQERRAAYAADITYAADKQVIFDYLRDRLASPLLPRLTGVLLDELLSQEHEGRWDGKVVQRGLHAAIVDEADSVLIDEAVTPAIISSRSPQPATEHYVRAAEIARSLTPGVHYTHDVRHRDVTITPAGREKLAEIAAGLPAFWAGPRRREELVHQALQALLLYRREEDYIVRNGEVVIVDRSTGRILPGRQWQLGLHQAVEAKEGLEIKGENVAVARCSYQAFFQKYQRLAGMTGTAREVANELWAWYRLPVVSIPTHKPVIRRHLPDRVFNTGRQKLEAVADRVVEAHKRGQPVLVGTWSVAASEQVGELIRARGVECEVLNANREAEEAAIVAKAGLPGAVTVATNMAGRGTDIQLTPESRAAGGLLVLPTERNDEARVDRQLAGRSGRQGDPGCVEPFVSLEDRLVQQHGLRVLTAIVRLSAGPVRTLGARLLWWLAQRSASRRWAAARAEASKADAWFEMAMHQVGR
mgnify:CR=1 FL=1|jgi:preprotein translocase subunit SecA